MLIFDKQTIGANLHLLRKRRGMTQMEVAEAAGLSDRAYADIERGISNMRTETLLSICKVLRITPNDILVAPSDLMVDSQEILERLSKAEYSQRETAFQLLSVYLGSLQS